MVKIKMFRGDYADVSDTKKSTDAHIKATKYVNVPFCTLLTKKDALCICFRIQRSGSTQGRIFQPLISQTLVDTNV